MIDPDDRMWLIYIAGIAHGGLLRVRSDLIRRDYESALRGTQENLEAIHAALNRDTKRQAEPKGGGK